MAIDWYEVMKAISPALQTIMVALITALVPVAGYYIRRLVLRCEAKLRASMDASQWDLALRIGEGFVKAAEELFSSGEGEAKLKWVKAMTAAQLAQYGINIDIAVLEGAIHGIVWDEVNAWKKDRHSNVLTPIEYLDPTFENTVSVSGPSV